MSNEIAQARYELYKRWMDDPVNPDLNEWWTDLNPDVQDSISELHKRGKVFEQDEIQAIEFDERKQTLVDEILNQDYLNADLFKTKISRQTSAEEPDDFGLIRYHQDGGREVVNDPKALNILLMDDVRPTDVDAFSPEMEKWSENMRKKRELQGQGYRVYNISKSYAVLPPKKEKTILDIVREPHTNQWQAWVNTWSRSNKSRERVNLMKDIGYDPEETLRKIALINAEMNNIPTTKILEEFHDPNQSWGEMLTKLGQNPAEILGISMTESVLQFFPSLFWNSLEQGVKGFTAGATGGGITAGVPGAIGGGMAGLNLGLISAGGMTSYNMEYTGKIFEALQEMGVDITDGNQLVDAFNNQELWQQAEDKAIAKGVPIALMDMVSFGVAGRLRKTLGGGKVGKVIENVADGLMGGSGEAMGQVASGEQINPSAIFLEAVGQPVQSAPMGMFNMAMSQKKAVDQSKFNKTEAGQEILRAREESGFDKSTIDMAEKLIKLNPEAFENKSAIEFIDEVKIITDAELKERGIDPSEFKVGEGVDPETGDLRALGSTEVENGQVIIKLYQGARPQDVIEEFYGNHFRRLSSEDKATWNKYYQDYKDTGGLLTEQEFFEKQGQMFYFGYNLATDSKVIQIFRKVKFYMDDMFNKAVIDPSIRKMYEDAGFGRYRDVDAEDGDVSYSIAPMWYNKSTKAVDKINASSIKARGLKNFFRNQGVSKDEMDAIKLDELLSEYKPIDSIPVTEIRKHIEKNEVQLSDWGTIANLPSETKDWTDERWEQFYEEEAEYEYPEETRYDIVQFGDTWRNQGMYAQTPGFATVIDAERAIEEEIDYRQDEAWYEIEAGGYDYSSNLQVIKEKTDDLERFPDGVKYHLYDGEYKVDENNAYDHTTDDPLTSDDFDSERISYTAKSMDDLKDIFIESERDTFGEDMYVDEFTHIDEDADPEIVNMPDSDDRDITPRWNTPSQVQPGGKDYQELVIKWDLPDTKFRQGHHFDVNNPLVHTRFNTRTDKDGNKVLFIEEIQSDWHQEGSKRGYDTATTEDRNRIYDLKKEIEELSGSSIQEAKLLISTGKAEGKLVENFDKVQTLLVEYDSLIKKTQGTTADAPYKDFNWISLAGKRLIKYAIDNNFDKIAWVTGEQQVDRNNLRKYIERIEYKIIPEKEGTPLKYRVKAFSKGGYGSTFDRVLEANELDQFLGKAVADRIRNNQGSELVDMTSDTRNKNYYLQGDIKDGVISSSDQRYSEDAESFYKTNKEAQAVLDKINEVIQNPSHSLHDKSFMILPELGDRRGLRDYETVYRIVESKKDERALEDLDLEVGGEKREKLYDVEIANRFKKLAGNLGTTELETKKEGHEIYSVDHQSIDLTDKVKEKYSKPMPSFSVVPEGEFNKKDFKYPTVGKGDFIIPISTRLKRIHPVLKKALRDFELKKIRYSRDDRKRIKPFLDKFVELADKNKQAFDALDSHLKNQRGDEAFTVAVENDMEQEFIALREYLDEMYEKGKKAGIEMGFIDSYFPRRIEDIDGLMAYFGRADQSIITKAWDKEKQRLGVEVLSDDDKANVINRLISNNKSLGKKTSHIKRRNQRIVVDENINKFYQDSPSTLLNYIDSMNELITVSELFGKGKKKTDSIGKYVAKLVSEGKITPAQQEEVLEIFRARFGHKASGKWTARIKNVGYGMTMGSPTSAITQIGDLAWALYMGGMMHTGTEFIKAVQAEFGKDTGQITPEDLGIERIAQELESTSGTATVLNGIFWATQLQRMDRLGKTTLVNASIKRYQDRAKANDSKLEAELREVYGDETTQLIKDLKSGKRTENVEMLAFNTLLDFQPVTLSEMPVHYLNSPNGRIFYQLKTFTMKQYDVFRNEAYDKIRKGEVKEGLQNLAHLALTFGLANAGADAIKDLLMGRKIHLDDYRWNAIWRLMGISRYHVYKTKDRGIGTGFTNIVMPVAPGIIDQLQRDLFEAIGVTRKEGETAGDVLKNMRSWTFVPLVGKNGYWWWGGGNKKITMQEIKRYREKRKDGEILTSSEQQALSNEASIALENGWISYGEWKNIVIGGK